MALPVVLVVVVPLTYFGTISLLPIEENPTFPAVIQSLLPADSASRGYRQFWMDAFTTLLCPMLFLSIPIVCSVASASCAFVSEKEDGTLETLLLSSINRKSVFHSKVTVCVLISVAISLVSFVVFVITVSVVDILISAPYFFSLEWLVTALLLMPALALFSVTFVTFLLPKVRGVGESLKTVGYLLLPVILLYLLQFTGVLRVSAILLAVFAILLMALAIVLFNLSARRFQAEGLVCMEAGNEN